MLVSCLAAGLLAASCGSDDATPATKAAAAPARATTTEPGVEGRLVVSAATSLTKAFTEIGSAFMTEHPDVKVRFNFAGSSDLARQIIEGAPSDVFASADNSNMQKITDEGLAAGDPVRFATNTPEIVVGTGNPKGITGVADLAASDVTLVICAPAVPCGKYAATIFANAGVAPTPKSLEENVGNVVTKVREGTADAGIVYATDVIAAGDAVEGVEIPADVNVIAQYPIAVTRDSSNRSAAQAFVSFVTGEQGQKILAAYGFTRP
jgi:molybdate transport system substrate-binding protein